MVHVHVTTVHEYTKISDLFSLSLLLLYLQLTCKYMVGISMPIVSKAGCVVLKDPTPIL